MLTSNGSTGDPSDEVQQAVLTLSGDRQFVRLAGQFIITSTIIVPVLRSSDPEADGKLQHGTWLHDERWDGQVKTKRVRVWIGSTSADAAGPARFTLRTALPVCKRVAQRHLFLVGHVQHLHGSYNSQLGAKHLLQANSLLAQALEESSLGTHIVREGRLEVGKGELQLLPGGQLRTCQQSCDDVDRDQRVLAGLEELHIFQFQS